MYFIIASKTPEVRLENPLQSHYFEARHLDFDLALPTVRMIHICLGFSFFFVKNKLGTFHIDKTSWRI